MTVERINGGLGGVQVHYRTVDGSAKSNIDYVRVSGTVAWADCSAGQRLIFIPILDNSVVDGNKNFFVELSQPESFGPFQTNQPALGFNCRSEVIIVDDDEAHGVIGFARPIYSFKEDVFDAIITVTRTNGSEGLVTVQYQTLNGSAIGGTLPSTTNDFRTITNGTLTFGTGETNKSFAVRINDDILSEFEENFSVRLFNVTGGGTLGLTNATVLIFDSETTGAGSISFTSTDYTVGESGGQANITLRRTGASRGTVGVEFRTTDLPPGAGAARASVDYGGITNTVTFGAGVTQQVVQIPILGDRFVEGPEQVALSLVNVMGGASIGFINTATLTIQDDDAYGSLSFGSANYYTPEEGGVAIIDVVRTGGDAEEVTVDFQAVGGTATDTLDFISTNGTLTFPDGVTVQTISVPILNDPDLEGPETVLLFLFNFSKAPAGPITNTVLTINDNESQAVPAGSIDTSFSPVPGPNAFVNTIAIQPDGQLLVGGEFTAFGGVVRRRVARMNVDGSVDQSFDPGPGADGDVNALVLQPDGKVIVAGAFTRMGNRNRGHIARLTSSGALDTSFNPGSGADNPVFALALQSDGKVLLGGDFATFNGISRKGIARLTANGVNDPIFQPGTGAGGTVFALALLSDGRMLVGGEFTTFNNQNVPYLARLNADGSVDGTFDSTAPLNGNVRAIAVQPDGRIVIGGSFTRVGATLRPYIARLNADGSLDGTFDPGAGADSFVYSVAVQSDGKILIAGEFNSVGGLAQNRLARLQSNGALDTSINFGTGANLFIATVVLQTDASIVIGGGFTQFNGVPRNYIARLVGGEDITPGTLQFIQSGYSVLESGTNLTVTIARVGGSQGQVEVDVISTDLGSAIGGIDYGIVDEHLIFVPGETIKTIVVGITNDVLIEPNEVFQLALTNVAGGAMLNDAAVTYVTIVNDDSAVRFTFPAFSVNEKVIGGNALIGVVRVGATNDPVSVDFATVAIPGGALPNLDFTPVNGTLTFLPGQTNLNFTVPIRDDVLVEGNEAFYVALTNVTGPAVISLPLATVNIIDNDFSPGSLSFNQTAYNVSESNANLTITIVRTNGASGVVSVNWSAGGGTALSGIDYVASGGVVSLADGETNETFTIQIVDDVLVEGNEAFIVTISNPTGGALISGPSAVVVTIEDDEFGPGSLDPTFNPGTGANSPVRSVGVAPDGRVVAGGEFTNFNGVARAYLVRLNVDGSVDLGFDTSVGANGSVQAVGVYPDGRVAAGGSFTAFNGQPFGRVVRVGANGLPDALLTQGGGANSIVNALLAGPSASVTVGGGFTQPTARVARFLADGGQDATFTPGTGPDIIVHALAGHPSGGVVIGGAFSNYNGVSRVHVAKLFPSGLLDPTFIPRVVSGGFVYAVASQPDGKVIIGGAFTSVDGLARRRIARFNASGTLDFGFNTGSGANADIRAIAVQPDGRIIVAGNFTNFNGVTRMRVARLEASGALDSVFDPGRGADNTVYSVALEPDGKVVIGGAFMMVNGFLRNGVARLNGDQPVARFVAASMGATGPVLTLRTTPGGVYVIDASTNLVNWLPLKTNTTSGYELIFTDSTAHGLDWRFYRARQVPR
ncbi:MAG TPA: Calx-beta domain-containing protein [Verrucomicrobiae bacterium]|nr:Calx-beta domain-containing protein [Verrucomicrobiae bacterium]